MDEMNALTIERIVPKPNIADGEPSVSFLTSPIARLRAQALWAAERQQALAK